MIKISPPYRNYKTLITLSIKTILICLLLILSNCGDEPVFIGRNLLPPSDNISIKTDSTTEIVAYTVIAKPILTASNEHFLIGSLNDSIFGYSEAAIVSQIDAVSPKSLPNNRFIDSLIVELKVKGYYGDSTSIIKIKAYELIEKLRADTSYFSDTDTDDLYSPVELGFAEFLPNDTIVRFKLTDQEYIDKFVQAEDTIFSKNNYFTDVFKGFYLEAEKYDEPGGAFAYFDVKSQQSKITLYYKTDNTDTVNNTFLMYFAYYSKVFNVFRSSYDSYPPSSGLNDPLYQDTVLFSTSMAGLDIRILFPNLEKWRDLAPVSIVKAELTIGIEDKLFEWDDYTKYPERFILYSVNDQNNYDILYDYRINSEMFGGYYNKDEKAYKINISYFLQSFLDKKIEKSEFALITLNNNFTANRVLLKSPFAEGAGRMKLRVIYTETR